jgi:UTP--glucose-1-phosphate uridylyltransferase
LGLGHAILQAKIAVGHEPFAVVLADDLIDAKKGVLKQMVEKYEDISSSIIAVQKINMSASIHYGMISTDDNKANMRQLNGIVEKPLPKNSPSDLAVVGRYIFANKIFGFLENTSFGAGNEIQLTDGIKSMLSLSPVYAFQFEGMRFDCGNKLDFIKASIEFSLKNPILGKELEKYLKSLLS